MLLLDAKQYKNLFIGRSTMSKLKDSVMRQYLLYKHRNSAFPKALDWDWKKTNYNRIALVNLLISKLKDCSYLEIGCAENNLFDAVPLKKKIGVDPIRGGTHRMTSDDFFKSNSENFDLIFIDGLHTYEQVRKDVVNAIQRLKKGGWVALHDMIPRDWTEQHWPIVTDKAWTGDSWKVGFELMNTKGIEFKVLKIDHGVGVFRLTSEKPELVDMQNEMNAVGFEYFYNNMEKLPIVEWDAVYNWITPSPAVATEHSSVQH
jgi:hypothetical protein